MRLGPLLALPFCLAGTAHAALIGLYTFEGGTANDVSGNGNHGVLGVGLAAPSFVPGFEGDALFLGMVGTGQVDLPIDINPATRPAITIGAWVNQSGSPASLRQSILSHDDGGFDRGLVVHEIPSLTGVAYSVNTGAGAENGGPNVASWSFLAAVYEGTTVTLDYNGVRASFPDNTSAELPFLRIGANPAVPIPGFAGAVDNVFVFDFALSPAQLDTIRLGGASAIQDLGNQIPEPAPSLTILLGLGAAAILRRRASTSAAHRLKYCNHRCPPPSTTSIATGSPRSQPGSDSDW